MAHKKGFEGYGLCSCCKKKRALKQLPSGRWECKRCLEGDCNHAEKEERCLSQSSAPKS